MNWIRIGIRFSGAAAAVTILLACSAVWLLLTSPVIVAGAIDEGTVTPVVRELATAFANALVALLTYL